MPQISGVHDLPHNRLQYWQGLETLWSDSLIFPGKDHIGWGFETFSMDGVHRILRRDSHTKDLVTEKWNGRSAKYWKRNAMPFSRDEKSLLSFWYSLVHICTRLSFCSSQAHGHVKGRDLVLISQPVLRNQIRIGLPCISTKYCDQHRDELT